MSPVNAAARAIALALLLVLTAGGGTPAAASTAECPMDADTPAEAGPAVDPPVELELAGQSNPVLNFGAGRGAKSDLVVLKASDPLPATVAPEQLGLDVLTPMRRIGSDTLESTELSPVSYSRPRIFDERRRVKMRVCVDAAGGKAGTYTGQALIGGPSGLGPATISHTAQLKTGLLPFLALLAAVLAITGLFLWFKIGNELKGKRLRKRGWVKALVLGTSLLAAGLAMFTIYNESPAWGADLFASALALLGAGLAAVGLGSSLSSVVGKFVEDV